MKIFILILLSLVHLTVYADSNETCGPIHDLKINADNTIEAFNIYFSETYDLKVNNKTNPELIIAFNKLYKLNDSSIDFDICLITYSIFTKVINGKVKAFVKVPKWKFIPLQWWYYYRKASSPLQIIDVF